MTDKQIIINGVDVSGCEHFSVYSSNGCCAYFLENEDTIVDCKNYPNCYYKRMMHTGAELNIHKTDKEHAYKRIAELQAELKAKEQECERLKWYMQEIRNQELCYLDIEWDEYETHCFNTEYSNIINLVEEALEERSPEDCRYRKG